MPGLFDLFVRSARERRPLACRYDGHERELCVHVIGTGHGRLTPLPSSGLSYGRLE